MSSTRKSSNSVLSFSSENWKVWALPVGVFLIIVFSGALVLWPAIQSAAETRDQIEIKQNDLDKLISRRLFLESLSEPQLKDDLTAVESVLYSRKPVFEFMISLVALAEEYEVTMNDFEFVGGEVASESAVEDISNTPPSEEEAITGELLTIPLEMSFSGTREQMDQFLEQINYTAPIMTFNGFQILDRSYALTQTTAGELVNVDDVRVSTELSVNYSLRPDKISAHQRENLDDLTFEERELLTQIRRFNQYELESSTEVNLNPSRQTIFDY